MTFQETALEELKTFIRFASVSADPAYAKDVLACADWLKVKLDGLGFTTELCPTSGYPVVFARHVFKPGRPTVMIYGHYDVQPVDPVNLWRHAPFEPVIEDGILVARGSADNKGQIFAHVCGVEKMLKEQGELPVNLMFVIEGEEEIGSKHFHEFLAREKDRLACDVCVISDTGMVEAGRPTFTYSLRGLAMMEVHAKGPSHDLHSGIYGGPVENPVTALARIVSTMFAPDNSPMISGFLDGLQPLWPWEKEAWTRQPLTEEKIKELTGVPAFGGDTLYSVHERLWSRPTIEINGFYGGYLGEGTKTVLPSEAHLKISFRLAAHQSALHTFDVVERHFRQHCPPGITLEIFHRDACDPYLVNPQDGYGKAAQEALRKTWPGVEPALIREGGSIGVVISLKRTLGVDSLLLGLALPDCRAHSPNENFPVENFYRGMELTGHVLEEIAKTGVIA